VTLYGGLSNKVHWSANNRKIAETKRSSVDAGTSRLMMLKWYCQAVHSRFWQRQS